jgi:beta-lactamase superfamily II metal-dependent hydrolase
MKKLLLAYLLLCPLILVAQTPEFSNWREGYLDIHHISTGSGNAAFFIFPDGTTMLFDAGDVDRKSRLKTPNPLKISLPLRSDSVSAGRAIADYIRQKLPAIKHIDYGVISHFHTDHFGSINSNSKSSAKGKYLLSGITEVNEYIPFKKIIDRNYPTYNYPVDLKEKAIDKESMINYVTFITSQISKKELSAEVLKVGGDNQIRQVINSSKFPSFHVRNVKSNGEVWTGVDEIAVNVMPDIIPPGGYNENPLSIALKISYGKFDYFTGGDMTGLQGFGLPSWFDVETPVAKSVGSVDALSLNHHGIRDASNEFFLKTLSPTVIVQQSYSSNHPGEEVVHRLISPTIFPGKRDIFATYVHAETIITYGRWLNDNYQSTRGHVVLRVMPDGSTFYVFILDDTTTAQKVLTSFGPYQAK